MNGYVLINPTFRKARKRTPTVRVFTFSYFLQPRSLKKTLFPKAFANTPLPV